MNKYFKKFSIMFVMSLILALGFCTSAFADDSYEIGKTNLDGTTDITQNSGKVKDKLTAPEVGWKRADDSNSNIQYSKGFSSRKISDYYKGARIDCNPSTSDDEWIKFNFYGSRIRLIDTIDKGKSAKSKISFDGGKTFEDCPEYGTENYPRQTIYYENRNLEKKIHNVIIKIPNESTAVYFGLDAVDIDNDGYLAPYNDNSIILDKASLTLPVDTSQQLIATTTPADTQVTWKSSDSTIATVDSTGKVNGVKEGICTITATTSDGLIATCTVTVTKKSSITNPNVDTGTTTVNSGDSKTNSYGILNLNTPSGFTQNNNNGGNGNSSNNSGNNNNSGNSGNNYSNNNNSNSNNNYYYYNNYYLSFNTKA